MFVLAFNPAVIQNPHAARNPLRVAVAADSKRAYVALQDAGSVAAIDLERMEVVGRVETGKAPDGIAWAQEQQRRAKS